MIEKIVQKYMKTTNQETLRYGQAMLTGVLGIIANLGLFLLKCIVGNIVHSISVISDGFNNLSDAFACFITVFGYRLSAKPADKEHPFGHGRMEYVVSFISVILIFIVTFELFTQSVDRILHPVDVLFSLPLFCLLVASIFVKIGLSYVNAKVGKRIQSLVLIASSQDARNDVFVTIVTLVAMLLSQMNTNIPFDGLLGIALSIYLFISACSLSKDIINALLGTTIDAELMDQLKDIIKENDEVIGVHDLIVHEYGPGIRYGNAHVEMRSDLTLMEAHAIVDRAEIEIRKRTNVEMVLHVDPIDVNDPKIHMYFDEIQDVLKNIDPALTLHDLRIVPGRTHINIIFDVLIPFSVSTTKEHIQETLENHFIHHQEKVHLHVTYDHGYSGDAYES